MEKKQVFMRTRIIALFLITVLFVLPVLSSCNKDAGRNEANNTVNTEGKVVFYFVDVGEGDCSIIKTPKGKFILVDCGGADTAQVVDDALRSLGCGEIEYAIFTHPHADHISGNYPVFKNHKINNILMTNAETTTFPYQKLLKRAAASGATVTESYPGYSFETDGLKCTVLGPDPAEIEYQNKLEESKKSLNDTSIATRFDFGQTSFLLCGDAEEKEDSYLMENYKDLLPVSVYKASHHGSSDGNGKDFLNCVRPEYAVISCGADNPYGHPHKETLRAFADLGTEVHRTDLEGTVAVTSDGKNISVGKTE